MFKIVDLMNWITWKKRFRNFYWHSSRKAIDDFFRVYGKVVYIERYRQGTYSFSLCNKQKMIIGQWWRGLASILPKVNNKAWNNTLSRLVMCQHLIAQSRTSTSIFMPGKNHNIQKSKVIKMCLLILQQVFLDSHIFYVFSFSLESQRERFLPYNNQGMKISKSSGSISRKN